MGVVVSTGAVAYGVPVELILQAASASGYAMIFSLLIAAIVWNLATWAMVFPTAPAIA